MKKTMIVSVGLAAIVVVLLVIIFELDTEKPKLDEKSSKGFLTFEEGEQKFATEKTLRGNNFTVTLTEKVGIKTP
jgi:hypothetical protein